MDVLFVAYGPIRDVVDAKELEREVPEDATVGALLADLTEEYPGLEDQLFDDGSISKAVSVTVNGTGVDREEGLDTALSGGDEIKVAPPIHGG